MVWLSGCPTEQVMVQAMSQRTSGSAIATSRYEDMPLSLVLFRFLWPFWLLKDASNGDRMTRAAAYRHNRDMRVYLPGYLIKWLANSIAALSMTIGLDALADHSGRELSFLNLLAATFGMAFACAVCVWVVTAYIYVFLSRHEN
jgi:hypothetical protein